MGSLIPQCYYVSGNCSVTQGNLTDDFYVKPGFTATLQPDVQTSTEYQTFYGKKGCCNDYATFSSRPYIRITVDDCIRKCNNNTVCSGFDFDNSENRCSLYEANVTVADAGQQFTFYQKRSSEVILAPDGTIGSGYTTYKGKQCCCDSYRYFMGDIKMTAHDCLRKCEDDSRCAGFHFGLQWNTCFLNEANCTIVDADADVTFYQKPGSIVNVAPDGIYGTGYKYFINARGRCGHDSSVIGTFSKDVDNFVCMKKCDSDPNCNAFAYSSERCQFFSANCTVVQGSDGEVFYGKPDGVYIVGENYLRERLD